MRKTALGVIAASILSIVACGGDDSSNTAGGSGTGGSGATGGSGGGTSGSGGTGTGGSSGSGAADAGGKAGSSPGADARADTPTGTTDAPADRPGTTDTTSTDSGTSVDVARDTTTPPSDAPTNDTTSPPDGGMTDATPPTDTGGDAPRDGTIGDASSDGSASIVVTSTGFTEGAMIPADFTCAGTNVSPPLSWTPGPAGTMSYAVVFTDRSGTPLIHSIIYDIPAAVTSLPMNVDKTANPANPAGAKQVRAYDNTTYGYLGPCPSGVLHNYEFSVRAIDVAALPGVTTMSTRTQVEPVLTMHTLANGLLNGQSNAKKGN